jgi:signal peptidase I
MPNTTLETADKKGGAQNKKSYFYAEAYEWVGIISFVLVIFVLLFTFVFREVAVDGDSMLDTLHNNDRLIICNVDYKPKNNDIVVIYVKNLHKPLVKRVIATGGQTVNIDYAAHRVYVDNVLQYEPFIKEPTAFMGKAPIVSMPTRVPKGYVFVMGDNRNDSIDSRSGEIGMVDTKYVLGKALVRYFPVQDIKLLNDENQ